MKISIIISVLNGEKYLSKSIESFLVQNYELKELIIIDGLSKDNSHKIIQDYTTKYPTLIKWINEKDNGISHSRNIAVKYAKGDLIGFLGCDDILHKDFFHDLQYYIKINPQFDVVYFNNYHIGNDPSFNHGSLIKITKRNLIKHCPISSGESFLYKKEIFDKFSFNENNKFCMDYELNMAIVTCKKYDGQKYIFYPINITAVFNVNSGDNISSSNSILQRLETIKVQLKYSDNFIEKLKIFWKSRKLIIKNYPKFKNLKFN